MSFSPFVLPRLTVVWPCADVTVQSVVELWNIAVYLHSKNPYLHSISHILCNNIWYFPVRKSSKEVALHNQSGLDRLHRRYHIYLVFIPALNICIFHGAGESMLQKVLKYLPQKTAGNEFLSVLHDWDGIKPNVGTTVVAVKSSHRET